MKTGIELIAEEREEQIKKHRWNDNENSPRQLMQAAIFALTLNAWDYPSGWHSWWFDKMKSKSIKKRLKISGALSAASIDRMNNMGVIDLFARDHQQNKSEEG